MSDKLRPKLIRSAGFHLFCTICAVFLAALGLLISEKVQSSSDIPNAYVRIKSFCIDNSEQLYLTTEKGILRYANGEYIGKFDVGTNSDIICVTADTISVCDYSEDTIYVYDYHGNLRNTAPFIYGDGDNNVTANKSGTFTKKIYMNGAYYELKCTRNYYTVTSDDGRQLYHTPDPGYKNMIAAKIIVGVSFALFIFAAVNYLIYILKIGPTLDRMRNEFFKALFGRK